MYAPTGDESARWGRGRNDPGSALEPPVFANRCPLSYAGKRV